MNDTEKLKVWADTVNTTFGLFTVACQELSKSLLRTANSNPWLINFDQAIGSTEIILDLRDIFFCQGYISEKKNPVKRPIPIPQPIRFSTRTYHMPKRRFRADRNLVWKNQG